VGFLEDLVKFYNNSPYFFAVHFQAVLESIAKLGNARSRYSLAKFQRSQI